MPHPRLADRAFAVRPLLDVAPDAVDFRTGTAYATLPTAGVTLAKIADALAIAQHLAFARDDGRAARDQSQQTQTACEHAHRRPSTW